ncbi:hypothetical protein HJFPF1_09855 [Paramyrothecium foliicola]|nr:hypothetical protein HJFPF1_09855 [Paramyrothecium foliicola]
MSSHKRRRTRHGRIDVGLSDYGMAFGYNLDPNLGNISLDGSSEPYYDEPLQEDALPSAPEGPVQAGQSAATPKAVPVSIAYPAAPMQKLWPRLAGQPVKPLEARAGIENIAPSAKKKLAAL